MSIATEISRLQADRNTIRNKLVELGMATNTDHLSKLAAAIEGLINQGAVSVTVQEGDTYTIPAGYHNGSGTVSGVAGGGNYSLQSKTVTPTKKQQSATPDSGYYGLSDVTIAPIPDAYQDVSSVTAAAGEVLTGKIIVTVDGTVVTGTMPNNGTIEQRLDTATTSYTIPKGYHSGTGKVDILPIAKHVIPSKMKQFVYPGDGEVLSEVTVDAIPANYHDTSTADAVSADIIINKTAFVEGGAIKGSMPDNGAVEETLNVDNPTYTIPKGYHSGTGKVEIVLETKTVTPTKSTQDIVPAAGKVLSGVTVAPIPAEYITTTDADAESSNILAGRTAYVAGAKVTGTMANNGAMNKTVDGLTTTSVTIPAGYTTGGQVSLTDDIETALAAI